MPLQMVSLYRDPKGDFVLNPTNTTLQTNETGTNATSLNVVKGEVSTQMRERLVELETLLKESQVSSKK